MANSDVISLKGAENDQAQSSDDKAEDLRMNKGKMFHLLHAARPSSAHPAQDSCPFQTHDRFLRICVPTETASSKPAVRDLVASRP